MRRSRWLGQDAPKRFTETIAAIEAETSAEIVVTVRDRASSYRHVDVVAGALLGLVALAVYLYAPVTFYDDLALPSVAAAFAAGAFLASAFDAPKRFFVSRAARQRLVGIAARAAFVEQRISATRDRTGILVYISLLENAVVIVTDIGVDETAMGEPWREACGRLEACARASASPERFAEALLALREPLARALPRREDDVNELADEVA